jgi:tryptophan synthase beta chain
MNLIEQEVTTERWVDIPEPVLEKYVLYRPSPLCRARNFERLLDAPVKIYYKYEGVSLRVLTAQHSHSASLLQQGVRDQKALDGTGAGQWGSALSRACAMFGLECRVFMVRVSYDQSLTGG